MTIETIRERLEKNRIPFQDELPEKLNRYLFMLREWNSRMDLTAVTDDDETLDKHMIDSLTVLNTGFLCTNACVIDVGTGAGFPGMVLAMARPDLHITLMDSQRKRLSFLEAVSRETQTDNIEIIHSRAEDGARKKELREMFDIAAARALAPMNVLCEYLLPYVKIGGRALCWKGPALKDELDSGRRAVKVLGGQLEAPVACPVEGRKWEHMILPILKIASTPALYPRKPGVPKNKPLGI